MPPDRLRTGFGTLKQVHVNPVTADPRMDAVRRGSLPEAFSAAFGAGAAPQGSPSPFALEDRTQEQQQHPEAPAQPLPAISAQTARLMAMPPAQMAAAIEALAAEAMAETRARAAAEEKLARLQSTPAAQLAAIRREAL